MTNQSHEFFFMSQILHQISMNKKMLKSIFSFLRNELYTRLVELELENHPICLEDINRLENGESPIRKKDKRKSTFQVRQVFSSKTNM